MEPRVLSCYKSELNDIISKIELEIKNKISQGYGLSRIPMGDIFFPEDKILFYSLEQELEKNGWLIKKEVFSKITINKYYLCHKDSCAEEYFCKNETSFSNYPKYEKDDYDFIYSDDNFIYSDLLLLTSGLLVTLAFVICYFLYIV